MAKETITLKDTTVADPLERFMTRLLRREIFEKLETQDHQPNEPYTLHMFGSGVVQAFRPFIGYPIRRLARDLDLGIVLKEGTPESDEIKQQVGQYIIRAVNDVEASIIPGSVKGKPGYDGFRVSKTYTPDQIRQYIHGKHEEKLVSIPDHPITVELDISEVFSRTPMLPLHKKGKGHFAHADIREVMGIKLYRMTSPEPIFEIRDVMDMYNTIKSGQIDIEKDAEIMRVVSLVRRTSRLNDPDVDTTLKHIEPTKENIEAAAKRMGVSDLDFMKDVFETVYAAVVRIYPKERSNLPEKMSGPLHLTLDELNFMTTTQGIEHLPGGNGTQKVTPSINAGFLVSAGLESAYPGLTKAINSHHELFGVLDKSAALDNFIEF